MGRKTGLLIFSTIRYLVGTFGVNAYRIGFCSPFRKDPSITLQLFKIEFKGVIFTKGVP